MLWISPTNSLIHKLTHFLQEKKHLKTAKFKEDEEINGLTVSVSNVYSAIIEHFYHYWSEKWFYLFIYLMI